MQRYNSGIIIQPKMDYKSMDTVCRTTFWRREAESSHAQISGFSSDLSDLEDSDPDLNVDPDVEMSDAASLSLHLDAFRLVEKALKELADLIRSEFLTDDIQRHLNRAAEDSRNLINLKKYIVALVGRSGTGKSTVLCAVLKCIGLPTSAEVRTTVSAQCY